MKTVVTTTAMSAVMSVLIAGAYDVGAKHVEAAQETDLALAGMPSSLDLAPAPHLSSFLREAPPPPDSPVADAAMRDDATAVRALVKQGADVNAAQGDGMTALHWAAQNGDAELVNMLLYAGANAKAVTRNGAFTPLHLASRVGDAESIRALIKAGANANAATTTGGATPLHFAAGSGNAQAVTALLEGGAEVDSRETAWEQTPLMWGAAYGYADVVKALIASGADIAAKSKVENISEVEQSAREDERRRDQRVRALAAARQGGAAGGQGQQAAAAPTPAGGARGAPAQGAGAQSASAQQQNALAVEGANVEVPLSYGDLVGLKGGLTPLLFAVRQGNMEAANALLEAGADLNQVSADNSTPMLMAAINGHFDLAKALLDRGADPNLASDAGATPLYAVINLRWAPKALYPQPVANKQQQIDYLELMEALLEAGADPNARLTKHLWYMEYNFSLLQVDTKGATPFWRAAYGADVPAMKLLIKYGADPNIPTEKSPTRRFGSRGNTDEADPSGLPPVPTGGPAVWPLHAASGVGFGEGYAANSHQSAPGGFMDAVTYLIEEIGVDVNARDHNGYNALHHAAARGDNDMVKYLFEHGVDIHAVSRRGQTVADMANGPVQRVPPFAATVRLAESLGSKNNNRCMSC